MHVVCQRPPKCHQCDNVAFRQRRQDGLTTLTKRPFEELPLQYLELVGNLDLKKSITPNTNLSLLDELVLRNIETQRLYVIPSVGQLASQQNKP